MSLLRILRAMFSPSVGARGERVAARYLRRRGYRVVARNLRGRFGEIDLLAEAPDGRTLVVVEVKAAAPADGEPAAPELRPEVHVNPVKQRKLAALAAQLVRRLKLADRPVRFDVIAVELPRGAQPLIRHHEAAFESHL